VVHATTNIIIIACSTSLLFCNDSLTAQKIFVLLWSPYEIGQTIISLALWFLLLFSFFSRLISTVADWMSAIVPHTVWPLRIYDAGLKRAARGSLKIQDARSRQKSPSGHYRTTLSGFMFATKTQIDNRKKVLSSNISTTCSHSMVTSAH